MVLPATDCYAVLLAAFFVKLDGYAELTHPPKPRKPPVPDQQVSNERLQNSRSAAYEEALKRWESDYMQPCHSVMSGITSRSVPSGRILFESVQQPEMRQRCSDKIRSEIA